MRVSYTKSLCFSVFIALTAVGCDKATELPAVTTDSAHVTDSTIVLEATVTADGGSKRTRRGFCWSTSPNPTTSDQVWMDGNKGQGTYSVDLLMQLQSQLLSNTKYYVRSFAENNIGLVYGNELSFRSPYLNPLGATINSRGCVECDLYAVGDTFTLNGMMYIVANRAILDHAILSEWDLTRYCISKITDLSNPPYMVNHTGSITGWDVSNVTNMSFFGGYLNVNQDIGNWDVSQVTNMHSMFNGATFNQDISNWDVSNVTDMSSMFGSNCTFNQDISNWDVSSVTDMTGMFHSGTHFNQDIGGWNVSNVTHMYGMFQQNTSFNHDIGDWDVSSVTDMDHMFQASTFNQDLTDWCVSQFPTEPYHFAFNCALAPSNRPIWGTCPP